MLVRDIVWRIPDKKIYLTFDDGPDENVTPMILDLLKEFHVKASFFVVGEKATKYPQLIQRMAEEGHRIGNHSFSHKRMWFQKKHVVDDEIVRTDEIIRLITGETPFFLRPPYGRFGLAYRKSVRQSNRHIVLWNRSISDYRTGVTEQTLQSRMQAQIKPGRIILLHDGHKNSLVMYKALKKTLAQSINYEYQYAALPPHF